MKLNMKRMRSFTAIVALLAVWVLVGCASSPRGPVSFSMDDTGIMDKGSPSAEAEKEAKLDHAKTSKEHARTVHPRFAGGKPGYMW